MRNWAFELGYSLFLDSEANFPLSDELDCRERKEFLTSETNNNIYIHEVNRA